MRPPYLLKKAKRKAFDALDYCDNLPYTFRNMAEPCADLAWSGDEGAIGEFVCAIPARYEIIALIPMGRPRKPFRVGRRRPAEQLTHWNRFGSKRQGETS